MNRKQLFQMTIRWVRLVAVLLTLFALSASSQSVAQAEPEVETSMLLQFTAGGHVLGFQPEGVYIVGSDHMLKTSFVGANRVVPLADQPPASDNQAQPLGTVTYPHLWQGISLIYEQVTGGVVKSSYLLEPGAEVDRIRLHYNVPVQVEAGGRLLFDFETGQMSESAPVAWQEIGGQQLPVEVNFHLLAEREVGFDLSRYNPAYPLVIDPSLLWNTFMGSSTQDQGNGITVDSSGNVYVTGRSGAWGTPVNAHAGGSDAFAAKLNSNGTLQWHTFMGSASGDVGKDIAVDGSGNVYVTGYSGATWGSSPVNAHGGSDDAFTAKLNSSGALQWNTFMGSVNNDYGYGIAVDGSGNVYVTGYSEATWGTTPVNAHAGGRDAFAAKLNSNNGALLWHTFMGSAGWDWGDGIAVDGSGNVYVAGSSYVTWGAVPVNAFAGGRDAFAAKLNSNGALQWNTFMGSANNDYSYGLAIDGSGNVYVTGESDTTWGTPLNLYAGGVDVFVTKLNSNGALQWHTFMGSAASEQSFDIAVDGSSNVYVTGLGNATWGTPLNPFIGNGDAFAAKLNSNGALQWNTFMGSASTDFADGIAVDGSSNVYVIGSSQATWGTPVNPHAGGLLEDVFVAKIGNTLTYLPIILNN
jgi:hypothetical protein